PWWASLWAYVVYASLLLALLLFVRRYEINRQTLKANLKMETLEAEKLKELDHFKSELYADLTHEFRTPLTVILGMVEQMKDNPKRYTDDGIKLIERNSKNLLHLINQLLDLSKLDNKAFKLYLQQSDIIPYLRYVTEAFQTFANSR
ncbi:MAG: HAMP domain-containing histidine kinase, partial [Saprospiraceae bacterium]|nr:HAMP domain-containing histidine kinase [Saprospiraceae bacterium]